MSLQWVRGVPEYEKHNIDDDGMDVRGHKGCLQMRLNVTQDLNIKTSKSPGSVSAHDLPCEAADVIITCGLSCTYD